MAATIRPSPVDDPFFSLRCALGVTIGFALIEPLMLDPGMVLPAMLVSLFCGQRGPYSPLGSVVTAAMLAGLIWLIFAMCVLTQGVPAVQFLAVLGICYGAFYLLLRTGNPLGVMLLIFTAMISVMFGQSRLAAEAMRDAFTVTAMVSALLIPLLNLLLPPRAGATVRPPPPPPSVQRPGLQALLRLAVLAPVLLAFLTAAPPSGLIFLIIVGLVLAYPTREARLTEGRERIISTVHGGLVALVILTLFTWQTHFLVLVLLVLLAALRFTARMVTGPASANTYQLGLSVLAVIVAGATVDTHPLDTAMTRLGLTVAGAVFALVALTLLEKIDGKLSGSRQLAAAEP